MDDVEDEEHDKDESKRDEHESALEANITIGTNMVYRPMVRLEGGTLFFVAHRIFMHG